MPDSHCWSTLSLVVVLMYICMYFIQIPYIMYDTTSKYSGIIGIISVNSGIMSNLF